MVRQKTGGYVLEQQIGHLLRRAHQRATAIFLAELGDAHQLTPTQFAALVKLYDLGQQSQNELGRLTAMDPATVQGVIRRLAARRLLERSADPTGSNAQTKLSPVVKIVKQQPVRFTKYCRHHGASAAPYLREACQQSHSWRGTGTLGGETAGSTAASMWQLPTGNSRAATSMSKLLAAAYRLLTLRPRGSSSSRARNGE